MNATLLLNRATRYQGVGIISFAPMCSVLQQCYAEGRVFRASFMQATLSMSTPSRTPLWKAFWLYGIIPSNLLWLAVAWLVDHHQYPAVTLGILVFLLGYTAWIVPTVWNATPNAKDPRYGVIAQALTVVWAINTVLVVFFLGLQMLRVLMSGG